MWCPLAGAAQVVVEGAVVDARTGAGLAAAHVQVAGSGAGTITNTLGQFALQVDALPVTLDVRYLGYVPAQVTFSPNGPRVQTVRLEPTAYVLGEVFVAGDDLAANIMRKVIEAQAQRRADLRTVRAEGFTRIVLEREGAIVEVSEAVFDAYWDRDRGPREVVRALRQTGELHEHFGMTPAGIALDLTAPTVPIQTFDFIGLTHPDALRHYRFSLAGRRTLGDQFVYDLYVAPADLVQPTFVGRLSVLDSVYAVLDVEVRPARHVEHALPVAAWDVFYRQQYRAVDGVWWPVDLRLEGRAQLELEGGTRYTPALVRQVSAYRDIVLNEPLPERPFATAQRVHIDSVSVARDYLFVRGEGVVPMTPREAEALARLRHGRQTLEQAFPPDRALAAAAYDRLRHPDDDVQFQWPVVYGYRPWLWYNRVDGFGLGVQQPLPFSPRFQLEYGVAQATARGRWRVGVGGRYRWGRGGGLRASYHRNTTPVTASNLYAPFVTSVATLGGADDYHDYVWTEGVAAEVRQALGRVRVGGGVRVERQAPIERAIEAAWPAGTALRPNPVVPRGTLRALTGSLAWGDAYRPLRAGEQRRLGLAATWSPGAVGDFDYLRLEVQGDWYGRTFGRRRVRPARLDVRVFASATFGDPPPQALGLIDGRAGILSAFGGLRTRNGPLVGSRTAGLFWAHDFQTVPFEVVGLRRLVTWSMGLRLFGGHARAWDPGGFAISPPLDRWHHEFGLGLTNLFGTPIRLDLARRLDRPGFTIGIGLSRLGE